MSKRSFESDKMMSVMYQPYAMPSSYGVCDRPPEKKPFRFPYVPSPPDSLHSDGSSYSHHSPGPAPSSTTSPLSLPTGNGKRPLTPLGLGPFSASSSNPASSAPATITSASQLFQHQGVPGLQGQGLRSPQPLHRHHSSHHSHSSSSSSSASATATITSHTHPNPHPHSLGLEEDENNSGGNDENEHEHDNRGNNTADRNGGEGNRVQYLSANCVVYENYRDETARAVEDHFNRALSAGSTSAKCSPMSTRNFPPSFWNSAYQPQPHQSSKFGQLAYSASDFYGAAVDYGSTFSGLSHHQSDPWHYPLTSHQSYHHRAADLSYPPMPSTSRFNPANYGSFFLAGAAATSSAASRFATGATQCGTNLKGETSAWPTGLYHHPHESLSELNLADYASAAAHYTNRTAGLETTVVGHGQESTPKDPYWF